MIVLIHTIRKNTRQKRRKLREHLKIGEEALVLAERIRKSQPLGNFTSNPYKTFHILIKKRHFLQKETKNRQN